MPYFLRKVRQSVWDGGTTVDTAWWDEAKKYFSLKEQEPAWSLYEANTDEDKRLLLAALALQVQGKDPIDLLTVPDDLIRQYGTVTKDGQGNTPLASANALHVSLETDNYRLQNLAQCLRLQGTTAHRYKWKQDVLKAIRETAQEPCIGETAEAAKAWRAKVLAAP